MNNAFARASGARATSARMTTDAGFPPGSVPARSASRRLRPSQQPTGAPIRGAVIPSGGMRPSQIAVVRSGASAAIPPVSSPAGGPSAGPWPSQVGLPREGDGAAKLRIQRCGIGSSCDCPPRDKLAGIEHDLHRATAAGGTPLPATSRERMEGAFSNDFAAVRVHTGAAAHDAASALGARALTAGTDILFRAGEYLPGTQGGDRLLAHELAHVVQQAHGLPQSTLDTGATDHLEKAAGLAADHASPAAEREAHGAAMIAAMGKPVPALSRQPPTIARQDDLETQPDASTPDSPTDAGLPGGVGTSPPDAGTSPPDAGTSPPDAGTSPPDAGTSPPDAGTSPPDAGTSPPDAGTSPPDAGTANAGAAWTSCVMPGARAGLNILAQLDNICGRMKAAGFCTTIPAGSGLRTIDDQIQKFAQGRSFTELQAALNNAVSTGFITPAKRTQWVNFFDPAVGAHPMPAGAQVTWTLHSAHLLGNAADVVDCHVAWGATPAFWSALNAAAHAEGLQIGPPPTDVAHVQRP